MMFILQQTIIFALPLLVVAMGGLLAEKSGVINIALEGIMVFGAFIGILFLYLFPNFTGQWALIVALLIAAVSGMIIASLHAFASVSMQANQSISGMSINVLAPAIAIFTAKLLTPSENIPFMQKFFIEKIPVLEKIPFLGPLLFQRVYLTTYIGLILFGVILFVVTKTKFGLRLRASGENPQALDASGSSVKKIRYTAVLLSGALAGLGGMIYFIPTSVQFSANVMGYGFLSIAVLVFSKWNIKNILPAAFFFGIMTAIGNTGIPFLPELNKVIPGEFFKMLPYVATIIILSISKGKSAAPSALGTPYDVGLR